MSVSELNSKMNCQVAYLFLHMALVDLDLLIQFVGHFLEQLQLLMVFLSLQKELLDAVVLLSEHLLGLSMAASFLFNFNFNITDSALELGNDSLATSQSVGLNLFNANLQVSHLNFERLLDGIQLGNTFLFFDQNILGRFQLNGQFLDTFVGDLRKKRTLH